MKFPKINRIVLRTGFWLTIECLEHDTSLPYQTFLQKIINEGNYNLFLRDIKPFLLKHNFIRIFRSKVLNYRYITLTNKGEVLKAYITKLRRVLNGLN